MATKLSRTNVENILRTCLKPIPSIYHISSKSACLEDPDRRLHLHKMSTFVPLNISENPVRDYHKVSQQRHCHVSKFHPIASMQGTPLTEERAAELICNLKDSERYAIKMALDKYEAMKMKETFEGKLAATQWRTRFGRLSQVPGLGDVDPTGSFCTFPTDWLKKRAAANAKEPTSNDLWTIFFVNAVPFVAFGFLDNFIMIVAGDYIEHWFGALMGLSTMAAAGLGNTVSDVMGIGSAHYVERGCEIMGLKPPDLTPIQVEMRKVRRSANLGRMVGIIVGCLLGMVPLMFRKDEEKGKAVTDKSIAK